MKDVVKIISENEKINHKALVNAVGMHILAAIFGFITSRAVVLDKLLPFGLSFLAGSSLTYTPAVATGVFLGYFFPAIENGGFRYISALFAILAVKLLLSGYKKIVEKPLFLSFICFLSSFLTSAVTFNGFNFNLLIKVAESLLAAGGSYFAARTAKELPKISSGLSAEGLSALFISSAMLIIGVNGFNLVGISLGHILSIALILTASKYGGITSGAVCGTALSLSLTLSGGSAYLAVAYAFMGLISGIFSSYGKYIQIGIPLIFNVVASLPSGNPILISTIIIETAFGSALFLAIPRRIGIYISKFFSVTPRKLETDTLRQALTMRLELAADALFDVSQTVEQVSGELAKINSPDFASVVTLVEQDACVGCKLRLHCWENRRDSTVEAILAMTKAIKEGSRTPETQTTEEFRGRCLRVSQVANSTYKRYSDYAAKISAENRIEEVRSVVSDQFDGISSMLSELSHEFKRDINLDNSYAEKVVSALKNLNIHAIECGGKTDKYGRITIELKIKREPDLIINKLQVMKLASVVCERDFDVPTVSNVGDLVFITLNEHASLRVEVGIEQKCASESAMCGDAYKYFFDGRGHFYMILSDGMGTGGRAAVDGAMAAGLMSRLIKAGFGFDCSLKILNSSMLFKSTDESLATIDIVGIDLYTGQVELYKAGAAPTLVRRSGRTGKAVSTSLPAGILRDIAFDKAVIKCKIGDIIVLMSDGAVCDGTDWIKEEIENWESGTAEELSARICAGAKRRRADNHEDDITVMTAILKRAV